MLPWSLFCCSNINVYLVNVMCFSFLKETVGLNLCWISHAQILLPFDHQSRCDLQAAHISPVYICSTLDMIILSTSAATHSNVQIFGKPAGYLSRSLPACFLGACLLLCFLELLCFLPCFLPCCHVCFLLSRPSLGLRTGVLRCFRFRLSAQSSFKSLRQKYRTH